MKIKIRSNKHNHSLPSSNETNFLPGKFIYKLNSFQFKFFFLVLKLVWMDGCT